MNSSLIPPWSPPGTAQRLPQAFDPQQALMAQMTPGLINSVIGMSSSPEKQEMYSQQLARAQALRNLAHPAGVERTGLGAGLAGAGDIFRTIAANRLTNSAVDSQQQLAKDNEAARQKYGNLTIDMYKQIADALRNRSQPQPQQEGADYGLSL